MPVIKKPNSSRMCKHGVFAEHLIATEKLEFPDDFALWTMIGGVASALGRDVWLDRGEWKTYPNLYIVLVAESTNLHKSTAIDVTEQRMRKGLGENFRTFGQKITPEKIINKLATVYDEVGKSEVVILADEFSTFLGRSNVDPTIFQILTTLYDCKDYFSYETISRGIDVANNVCVNMLAGTTPDWLKSCIPEDALGGGFFSRLILVNRTEPGPKNPCPEDTIDMETLRARDNVINDLEIISRLKGPYNWTPESKKMYKDWYHDYNNPDKYPVHLRGYYGRKRDMVIKLAMIGSASVNDSMLIQPKDVEFALDILGENEQHLKGVVEVLGTTEEGRKRNKVLAIIKKNGEMSHSALFRNVSYMLNSEMFRSVLDGLIEEKLIESTKVGRARHYKYIGN